MPGAPPTEAGDTFTVTSFSHALVGDCVKILRVGGSPNAILEKFQPQPVPAQDQSVEADTDAAEVSACIE